MTKARRPIWRRFRALPGRAQAAIAAAVAVAFVVAVALTGPAKKPASILPGVAGTTASTAAAPSTTAKPPALPVEAPATSATTALVSGSPDEAPGTCHVRGGGLDVLPDPTCTPGATNPGVTQSDIDRTICASGWTETIRPPESYTEPLKLQQMAAYGETGPVGSYEEDHLISLELGGSPTDPRNLWPEPGASPNPKDGVEDAARRAVCDRQISLAAAQHDIATNWIAFGQQLGVMTTSAPPTSPATSPATTLGTSATTAASGCSPRSSTGNCYRAGEYCPDADHGETGTDANGETIKCEDVDGSWRWEHA
jgi:hypothetical protein